MQKQSIIRTYGVA